MVKYGPADSRSAFDQNICKNETLLRPPHQQPTLWLSGSASQASDQGWRRPRVHLRPAFQHFRIHNPETVDFDIIY